jgi:hypothetical protein
MAGLSHNICSNFMNSFGMPMFKCASHVQMCFPCSNVLNAVNQFVRYWNTHKTRKQSNKYLPSGVAPEEVVQHPENFGLHHAGIPVDLNVVCELRNTLPKSREDCFRWVPLDFDSRAIAAYIRLQPFSFRLRREINQTETVSKQFKTV